MSLQETLAAVNDYYSQKIAAHGPTASGADWNSSESQILRFEQLLKVCDTGRRFSINDYGSGYGALVEFMNSRQYEFDYRGFDISEKMLAAARKLHSRRPDCAFVADESLLKAADYTVASGIFNVRLQTDRAPWEDHVLRTIQRLNDLSTRGFAFNVLTKYSDRDRMQPHLYYADPCFLFDHCKKCYSRNVALLHDYGLYEFTLLVRLD